MPDGISNVDPTILKLAKQYHDCNVRSGAINEERTQIRENVEKLGIDPGAFQVGVRMAKAMTPGQRGDFTGSLTRVLGVMDGAEADIFGQADIDARNKRAEKRAQREAKARGETPPDNPKGDPKRGGAGGVDGHGKAKDGAPRDKRGRKADNAVSIKDAAKASDAAVADSIKAVSDKEQAEGGAVLDGAVDRINGAAGDNPVDNAPPKSQSAIAQEKLEAAKLG